MSKKLFLILVLIFTLLLLVSLVDSGKKHKKKKKNAHRVGGFIIYRIVRSRIEYLLQQQVKDGYWSPPKGHAIWDEPTIDAAVRETHEETGWFANKDYRIYLRSSVYFEFENEDEDDILEKVHLWPARLHKFRRPVKLSPEHAAYGWFPFKEAVKAIQKEFRNALVQAHHLIKEHESFPKYHNQENDIASFCIGCGFNVH